MRRQIEPHLKVYAVDNSDLKEYENRLRGKLGSLPQTPDVSVIYTAEKLGIPIVSSDLKLVETAEKLGLKTYMNSSFAIFLKGLAKDPTDQAFLEEVYQKLFADEVSYSVKGQHVYDPVIRLQKVMDSALKVVRAQETKTEEIQASDYDFQEYLDLSTLTKEVRTDLSDYVAMMEEGAFDVLSDILEQKANLLLDRCTEVRLLGIPETDPIYREALTSLAHILLLNSTVNLGLQRLEKVHSIVDLLLLLLFEIKDVADRIEIEVHLQRIILYFLSDQISRLNVYFNPSFISRCLENGRQDIAELMRTFGIIAAVLTNKEAEKNAIAKDFSEIQFVIQLGYQFAAVKKPQYAWLLFEQAIYMSLNSEMTGLLYAVFEVMLPLHYATGGFSPSLIELFDFVESKADVKLDSYRERLKVKSKVDPDQLVKRQKSVDSLPETFQGFLDVIEVIPTSFKQLGRAILVKVIDWQSMTLIGIIDPTLTLDETLYVGTSVKIHSGKVKLIEAPKSLKEKTNVNLLIVCYPENLKFIVRRAGIASLARPEEKVIKYDL